MQNLREMNVQARAAGVHLVLITYASEKQFCGQANRVIRHAARQHNLSLLDVRPSFQRACPAGDANLSISSLSTLLRRGTSSLRGR